MLVIAFVSMAENYLDVDKGVFFYAFFFSFFVYTGKSQKPTGGTKTRAMLFNTTGNQSSF